MSIDKTTVKRAWVTPQIVVYGSLEELTKGSSGTGKGLGTGDDFARNDLAPLS